jgi:CTP synthase
MQMAVVEFGRNVMGYEDCHSLEFNPDARHPVISLMQSQESVTQMGGTMRLGVYDCEVQKDTLAYRIFKKKNTGQRHRHRYEFNNAYYDAFCQAGMVFSGINPETQLVEMIELPEHPFFLACQFHPEYKSTVEKPHPMYTALVRAMHRHKQKEVAKV